MKNALCLLLIVLVTVTVGYFLVRFIGIKSTEFAMALNFMLMTSALLFTEALKSRLQSAYFCQQPWEAGGKVYIKLGVNLYRKLLLLAGWEKLHKMSKPVGKDAETLANLYYKTKQDELGHLIVLIIVSAFMVVVAIRFGIGKAIPLFISNILLNLYPVMLQRFNRPRIARVMRLGR